jgi:hypothetical protein
MCHKTVTFIVTALKTPNPTSNTTKFYYCGNLNIFKFSKFLLHRKNAVSIAKTNLLTMRKVTTAVHCDHQTEYIKSSFGIFTWLLDCFRNVIAHAQNPDFVFRRNGRVHLNGLGRQFSRLLAANVCTSAVAMIVILDTPRSEVV